jgi:type IV secretion system protein VirD4
LPGAVVYWASTAVAFAVAGGIAVLAVHPYRRFAGISRRRFGVETSARLARRPELRRLILARPTPGRFMIGRVGRWHLATEDVERPLTVGHARALERGRAPQRTSVAMLGPTRCGKTAAAISGILQWIGPAILSSVKSDLMSATIELRRACGEVRIFDPTGLTSRPTCGWSPLRGATTVPGAQRAARALVDAGPRRGAQDLDFFLRLAEQVLWPHLLFAANRGRSMRSVVEWVLTQQSPVAEDTDLANVIELTVGDVGADRLGDARHAERALAGIWGFDHRTRSSAYATAQTLLGAWTDTGVINASETEEIDLEWLLEGQNTLYICSPLHEQQRLAPVFGALLGDLVNQAYERETAKGHPMRPTLLLLDEAANTPTRWLPQVASTCAGIGLLLVTIWQSKAQLDSAYGDLADSVLTNHGTKLLFAGPSDLATLEYARRLLGDEEALRRGTTVDQRDGRRTITLSHQYLPLLPVHVLRQGRPGHALLVHADLPPAQLRTVPYYRDRRLRELVSERARMDLA